MDDVDRAEINRQREIDAAIANARGQRSSLPAPTGKCHYCREDVGVEQRWCDAECSGLWERENE